MTSRAKRCFVLAAAAMALVVLVAPPGGGKDWKKWNIHDKMTRDEIQAVINAASDGDHIVFHKGLYDFGDAPFYNPGDYRGALEIVDKSLVLEAKKDVVIKGAPSLISGDIGVRGITAIVVKNAARDKDVTIEGLGFDAFLIGISVLNGRSITVRNCVLNGIDRNGVAITGAGGDIDIQNSRIFTRRMGIFVDWYYSNLGSQPVETQVRIEDNTVSYFETYTNFTGIYVCQSRQAQVIRNSVFSPYGYGINLNGMPPAAGEPMPRSFISGNTIQGLQYGVNVSQSSGVQVDNNAISQTDWGVGVYQSTDCDIRSNTMSDIRRFGIILYAANCAYNQVTDNRIHLVGSLIWEEFVNFYGIITYGHHNYFSHNVVTGTGSAAYYVWCEKLSPGAIGHDEVFECNDAVGFTPAPGAAHYIFFGWYQLTYNNRFSETWANGVTYLNLGASTNVVTTLLCR